MCVCVDEDGDAGMPPAMAKPYVGADVDKSCVGADVDKRYVGAAVRPSTLYVGANGVKALYVGANGVEALYVGANRLGFRV